MVYDYMLTQPTFDICIFQFASWLPTEYSVDNDTITTYMDIWWWTITFGRAVYHKTIYRNSKFLFCNFPKQIRTVCNYSLLLIALSPGFQFIATPEKLTFDLRISSATSRTHIEPFFTSAALYDAKFGKKISEEIHFDLNGEERELFDLFLSTFELEQFAMDHPGNYRLLIPLYIRSYVNSFYFDRKIFFKT